mgnify:CR=1 FL=1
MENEAKARGLNLPISTKHCIEICNFIRYKTVKKAKKDLNLALEKKIAIPLTRFHKDRGHKKGKIGPGFYPENAAKQIIKLLNLLEANAQNKGLNKEELFLKTLIVNKASTTRRFGRRNRSSKRTHIEMIAEEKIEKKEGKEKQTKVAEKKLVKSEQNPRPAEDQGKISELKGEKTEK